jgi:hypothetical protein
MLNGIVRMNLEKQISITIADGIVYDNFISNAFSMRDGRLVSQRTHFRHSTQPVVRTTALTMFRSGFQAGNKGLSVDSEEVK